MFLSESFVIFFVLMKWFTGTMRIFLAALHVKSEYLHLFFDCSGNISTMRVMRGQHVYLAVLRIYC